MVVNNIHLDIKKNALSNKRTHTHTHTHTHLHSGLLENTCKNIYTFTRWNEGLCRLSTYSVVGSTPVEISLKIRVFSHVLKVATFVFLQKTVTVWKLQDGQIPSRQEVLCFLLVMLSCRWLADTSNRIWALETRERPEISGCFMAKNRYEIANDMFNEKGWISSEHSSCYTSQFHFDIWESSQIKVLEFWWGRFLRGFVFPLWVVTGLQPPRFFGGCHCLLCHDVHPVAHCGWHGACDWQFFHQFLQGYGHRSGSERLEHGTSHFETLGRRSKKKNEKKNQPSKLWRFSTGRWFRVVRVFFGFPRFDADIPQVPIF